MDQLYSYKFEMFAGGAARIIETIAQQDSTAWVAAAEIAGRYGFTVRRIDLVDKTEIKIVLA